MNLRCTRCVFGRALLVVALGSVACAGRPVDDEPAASTPSPTVASPSTTPPTIATSTTSPPAGTEAPTHETSPPPRFASSIGPLAGEPLDRSSWNQSCPVGVDDLRYVTVSYWDFGGEAQTGELIVAAEEADNLVEVFARLFEAGYPISEMRIVTRADIDDPDPLSNNSASFACRVVRGSNVLSQHAYGLAVDINPFYNPYVKGDVVIPGGAGEYTDRTNHHPAVIGPESVVVEAFAEIGWAWGGNWNSLKDYQHFSLRDR